MVEKKRKTWLWILGWIVCFPIPLTILMLRNKRLSPAVRYAVIGVSWVALLLFTAVSGGGKSKESAGEEPAAHEQAATQEQAAPEQESAPEAESTAKDEGSSDEKPAPEEEPAQTGNVYILDGSELGEFGTAVILNEDTDMPVEKHLYKLPAGRYRVTTTNKKFSAFCIVKDEVGIEEGNDEYPENLVYVSNEYVLTAGDNDLNGTAQKEVEIEIASDESISLPTETDTIIVEELL